MTEPLAESLAERLLDSIIEGEFAPHSLLPSEGELGALYGVSRLTIRESVRILRTQNIVRIRRGRGTEVNAPEQWTSLEAIIRASANGSSHEATSVSERLLEARRMIEVGAVQLAAVRRTQSDLDALQAHLEVMRSASGKGDVAAFVDADIQFHDVIMRASGNIFVPLLFGTFGPLLVETRHQTSAVPEIQRNAIAHHTEIFAALKSGEPESSRAAMEEHMDQTERDLRHYVMRTAK